MANTETAEHISDLTGHELLECATDELLEWLGAGGGTGLSGAHAIAPGRGGQPEAVRDEDGKRRLYRGERPCRMPRAEWSDAATATRRRLFMAVCGILKQPSPHRRLDTSS